MYYINKLTNRGADERMSGVIFIFNELSNHDINVPVYKHATNGGEIRFQSNLYRV